MEFALLLFEFVAFSFGSQLNSHPSQTQSFTDYWMANISISYFDKEIGNWISEEYEAGRYSTLNEVYETEGLGVFVTSMEWDNSGCRGPFIENYPPFEPWIAIIQRGKCTFNQKIANAVRMNASGVLIFDNEKSATLQSMKVELFNIPSVFTFQDKGEKLERLIQSSGKVLVKFMKGSHCKSIPFIKEQTFNITDLVSSEVANESGSQTQQTILYCGTPDAWSEFHEMLKKQTLFWNWNFPKSLKHETASDERKISALFGSGMSLILMMGTVVWMIFFMIQSIRRGNKRVKKVKDALSSIPTSNLKLEDILSLDAMETCAVCIDQFLINDIVRYLPCKHLFHKNCIDQWLLENPTCPICKLNVLEQLGIEKTSAEFDMI